VDGDIGTVQSRIDLHCNPHYTSGKKRTVVPLNFVYSGRAAAAAACVAISLRQCFGAKSLLDKICCGKSPIAQKCR